MNRKDIRGELPVILIGISVILLGVGNLIRGEEVRRLKERVAALEGVVERISSGTDIAPMKGGAECPLNP